MIERLYATREGWLGGAQPATALAGVLQAFGLDEQKIAHATTLWDLSSRILFVAGQIAQDLGVKALPTVFVNGERLERPQLSALDEAVLSALPPETAARLQLEWVASRAADGDEESAQNGLSG